MNIIFENIRRLVQLFFNITQYFEIYERYLWKTITFVPENKMFF